MIKIINQFINWYSGVWIPRWKSLPWSMILAVTLALLVSVLYYYKLIEVSKPFQQAITQSEKAKKKEGISLESPQESDSVEISSIVQIDDFKVNQNKETRQFNYSQQAYEDYLSSIKKQTTSSTSSLHFIWIGVMLIFLISAVVNYRKQKELEIVKRNEDPESLSKLFLEFEEEIVKLRTPRKIKRLVNKLRFQYNLLEAEKLINRMSDKQFLFDISIKAELDHDLFNSFDDVLKEGNEFYDKKEQSLQLNEELITRIHQLNRNIFGKSIDRT